MDNKVKKKKYIAPYISAILIELEHSIAASSTSVIPGGAGNNPGPNPDVNTEDVKTDEHYWDF